MTNTAIKEKIDVMIGLRKQIDELQSQYNEHKTEVNNLFVENSLSNYKDEETGVMITRSVRKSTQLADGMSKELLMEKYPDCVKIVRSLDVPALKTIAPELITIKETEVISMKGL